MSTTEGNGLTRRQQEVLSLLKEGCTHAEAAERLGLSARTVSKHAELAFKRLGVSRLAHALQVAGLVRLPRRGGSPGSPLGRSGRGGG
jgi:DNA-binding NarL/FixJ family response regulator